MLSKRIASPRTGGEHVFDRLAQTGGKIVRSISLVCAEFGLLMAKSAVFNHKRMSRLLELA